MRQRSCWHLFGLLVFCILFVGVSSRLFAGSEFPDSLLPSEAFPQPSIAGKGLEISPLKRQLPLVQARYLENLSNKEVKHRYPRGVQVLALNATMALKNRLEKMQKKGFSVVWLEERNKEMQALTFKVVSQSNYVSLLYFLSRVYEVSGGGQVSTCSPFLKDDFIPYAINEKMPISKLSLGNLNDHPTEFYQRLLVNSHFWNDIGYNSMVEVPERIQDWLARSVKATETLNKLAIHACHARLPRDKFTFVSQLIALSYLSDAVKGLYYKYHDGQLRDRYIKLAVETLKLPSDPNLQ